MKNEIENYQTIKEAILFLINQRKYNLKENPLYQDEYKYLVNLSERLEG